MKTVHLNHPYTEQKIRDLQIGDHVLVSGLIYTGRDAVHKYLFDGGKSPVPLRDQILYHCGPVVIRDGRHWKVTAAGPTTSTREEPYQAQIIKTHGIRGVIGKGGMGPMTVEACKLFGCVYLHAVGGAAQVLADCIQEVQGVHMAEEFGTPEAIWEFVVKDFPATVTIDAHGNSLHKDVFEKSKQVLEKYL